jgi:hypothetical protein
MKASPISTPGSVLAQRAAGQGQEHVVQRGTGQLDRLQRDRRVVQRAQQAGQGLLAVVHGQPQRALPGAGLADARQPADCRGHRRRGPADPQRDHVPGHPPLELVGRAAGHDPAVVDEQHPVAQRVGLVQVVRGEEHGGAEAVPQPADVLPQVAAALRVEPGGRLVQEHQPGPVDQAQRDVQPLCALPSRRAPLSARRSADRSPGKQRRGRALAGRLRRQV